MPGWAWALIAVGVLAAGLLVALVAVGGDSKSPKDAAGTDGRSLRAPAEVGDYAAVTSIDPHQLAEQFRGQLSQVGSGDVIDHAKIGVYGRTAQPRIVFIGFELGDVPQMKGQVADNGVESSVESFSAGIVKGVSRAGGSVTSSVHSVDPGPLGGFMRCGAISLSAQRVGICAWGDRSAMAMTMVINPANDAEIARLTLQARAAAEH